MASIRLATSLQNPIAPGIATPGKDGLEPENSGLHAVEESP